MNTENINAKSQLIQIKGKDLNDFEFTPVVLKFPGEGDDKGSTYTVTIGEGFKRALPALKCQDI